MTKKEFDKKWGNADVDNMSDDELRKFKNDCFDLYESTGFTEIFNSPYDDEGEHNGKPYKVIRRATESEADLEAMPIWVVKFEGEDEVAYCYPEEIAKIEQDKN